MIGCQNDGLLLHTLWTRQRVVDSADDIMKLGVQLRQFFLLKSTAIKSENAPQKNEIVHVIEKHEKNVLYTASITVTCLNLLLILVVQLICKDCNVQILYPPIPVQYLNLN